MGSVCFLVGGGLIKGTLPECGPRVWKAIIWMNTLTCTGYATGMETRVGTNFFVRYGGWFRAKQHLFYYHVFYYKEIISTYYMCLFSINETQQGL